MHNIFLVEGERTFKVMVDLYFSLWIVEVSTVKINNKYHINDCKSRDSLGVLVRINTYSVEMLFSR